MAGLELRCASAADAAPLARLIRLAFASQSVPTDPPPSALLETAEAVAAHFCASGTSGGGAVAGDFCACVLWEMRAGGLYVRRLAVHPHWRRRGLARRLMGAAEQAALEGSHPRLWLSTRLVLLDNRRLFAAFGFVEVALQTHAGYTAPTSVDMQKILVRRAAPASHGVV